MRLRRLLFPIVAGAAAYFAVFGGEYSLFERLLLEQRQREEAAELETLRDDIARLRARADSLEAGPAALERLARERYGMIRGGERLYRFVEVPASDAGVRPADADRGGPRP